MITIKNIYFLNRIGKRPQLEDSIYPAPGKAQLNDRLFMVCDGVGGENLGEEASRIACESFSQFFTDHPPASDQLTRQETEQAQHYVLSQMAAYATAHPEAANMSTTLTLIYIGRSSISAAWCGDSRIYHLRHGKVRWHSGDHSLVANLVRHGEITAEEAKHHPQRNVITRSLSASGHPSEIELHYIDDIREDDIILLCTDGLLEQINESRLAEIILDDREDKTALFLRHAEGQTKDNFSMYLLSLNSPAQKKAFGLWLIAILLVLVTAVATAWFYFQKPAKMRHRATSSQNTQTVSKHTSSPETLPVTPQYQADTVADSSGQQGTIQIGIDRKQHRLTVAVKHLSADPVSHQQPLQPVKAPTASPAAKMSADNGNH